MCLIFISHDGITRTAVKEVARAHSHIANVSALWPRSAKLISKDHKASVQKYELRLRVSLRHELVAARAVISVRAAVVRAKETVAMLRAATRRGRQ